MGKSKPKAEREGTPLDETAPASDRVLRPKPPPRPKPPSGFYTSIEARMNAFDLSSDGLALPPKPPTGLHASIHAPLPSRNAHSAEKQTEVIVVDSDSDEAMEEEAPKPTEAMQIDMYSTPAMREEQKRAAKQQKRATRKAFRPVKQMIHKAIPNSKQRQKFYEQAKNPDRNTLDKYLEEIRLKEIALRVMVKYCTEEGGATRSYVGENLGGAPVAKSWLHGRSSFAERAPLREWELD